MTDPTDALRERQKERASKLYTAREWLITEWLEPMLVEAEADLTQALDLLTKAQERIAEAGGRSVDECVERFDSEWLPLVSNTRCDVVGLRQRANLLEEGPKLRPVSRVRQALTRTQGDGVSYPNDVCANCKGGSSYPLIEGLCRGCSPTFNPSKTKDPSIEAAVEQGAGVLRAVVPAAPEYVRGWLKDNVETIAQLVLTGRDGVNLPAVLRALDAARAVGIGSPAEEARRKLRNALAALPKWTLRPEHKETE